MHVFYFVGSPGGYFSLPRTIPMQTKTTTVTALLCSLLIQFDWNFDALVFPPGICSLLGLHPAQKWRVCPSANLLVNSFPPCFCIQPKSEPVCVSYLFYIWNRTCLCWLHFLSSPSHNFSSSIWHLICHVFLCVQSRPYAFLASSYPAMMNTWQ